MISRIMAVKYNSNRSKNNAYEGPEVEKMWEHQSKICEGTLIKYFL